VDGTHIYVGVPTDQIEDAVVGVIIEKQTGAAVDAV
jgi:hypothetical protein